MNLAESLDWIKRVAAKRAVLTNLHSDLDYEALRTQLPAGVVPGFDGMQIII
jgi:phosphoribosyl 1,2-cyclic phosphate phosphodiesterase